MNSNPQCLFKVFSQTLINSDVRPFFSAKTTTTTTANTKSLFTTLVSNKSKQLHVLNKKNNLVPLLIVPNYGQKNGNGDGDGYYSSVCDDTIGFISLFDDDEINKKKKAIHKLYLPEIADRRICGSSEGWLITIHENTEVQLLNPFTKVLVNLPPLITSFPEVVAKLVLEKKNYEGICYLVIEDHMSAFLEQNENDSSSSSDHRSFDGYDSRFFRDYFKKVVTSTTTTTTDANNNNNSTLPTVVMAIYGDVHRLAFCRPSEQKKWIGCLRGDQGIYEDVTFYKGSFYAVGALGNVVVVKGIEGPSPFVETILIDQEKDYYLYTNYLVESSSSSSGGDGGGGGDLLKVMRRIENTHKEEGCSYRTTGFRVMKLDFNGGPPSFVEVTNLGEDCALFIGYNHSLSLSASKIPGCRGNCIYFTDGQGKGHDMGVYNLEDGSIETLYETTSSSKIFIPPPVWYVPNRAM